MKKGAIHVDWVISIGIFLTYIAILMLYVKPGQIPAYKDSDLIQIISNKFEEETTWTIKEVPVYVANCNTGAGGAGVGPRIKVWIEEKSTDWDPQIKLIIDEENSVYEFNNKIPYSPKKSDPELINLELKKQPGSTTCNPENIGTPEDLTGINKDNCFPGNPPNSGCVEKLKNNNEQDYKNLKDDWKIPKQKDFEIVIENLEDNTKEQVTKSPKPPEGVNVFVREYFNQYVNKDGVTTPIQITIKVW